MTYLQDLETNLKALPKAEIKDAMLYYEQYFYEGHLSDGWPWRSLARLKIWRAAWLQIIIWMRRVISQRKIRNRHLGWLRLLL